MTAVTVDLDDLTTIVFATAAIKTIEGTLANRRTDPFVRPHLDFTAAHDRLATAMRNATRAAAGTAVNFDEPLTKTEVRVLRDVRQVADSGKGGLGDLPWFVISGPDKEAIGETMSIYDRLAAKGCVKVGQIVTGVVWSGDDKPSVKADPTRGFACTITDRGRAMLTAIEASSTVLGAG